MSEGLSVAPRTQYVRSGDVHLAYHVVGGGPIDLVLFPNLLQHLEAMWDVPVLARFLSRLASFSRLILFDQRGTGMSDPVALDGLPHLEQRIDDARVVMDAVGSDRAAIFAIQSGVPAAVLFAAAHPDRVSALALANPLVCGLADPGAPGEMTEEVAEAISNAIMGDWGIVPPDTPPGHVAASEAWARYQRWAGSPGTARAWIRIGCFTDVRPVVSHVRVPTLVMVHPESWTAGPIEAHARYLADNIEGARFVLIEGPEPIAGDYNMLVDDVQEFFTGGIDDQGDVDRILATVLFTDIVGSTEQAAKQGDRAWRDLLAAHDAMVRRELERFRGREVKALGDGFLAVFDGPARAIRCATAIRDGAQQLGIEARAGLHTGEIEMRGEDVGGIAVSIAARVADLAAPSEVMVSRTLPDLVAGSGLGFVERGQHRLKGVPGEWQLYAVAV